MPQEERDFVSFLRYLIGLFKSYFKGNESNKTINNNIVSFNQKGYTDEQIEEWDLEQELDLFPDEEQDYF